MPDAEIQLPQLFSALRQAVRDHASKLQADERRQILSFTPTQVDDLGHVLFTNLQKGGFCTFIVSGRGGWNPRSYYFECARQAAGRGREITRAFLLPHRHYRTDPILREHVAMDRAAGINVVVLSIGDLLSKSSVPMLESLDVGIWDDKIVCSAVRSPTSDSPGPAEWRVSARPEDLQHSREVVELLLKSATRLDLEDMAAEQLNLEEPMVSTAPIANFLSGVLCRGNHVASDDCSWYHSVWQYLRVFNMVSTPTWHSQFYFDALRAITTTRARPRILISGTADYSMLAHVLWVYEASKTAADVVVLDLCETPLFLCRWYAKSVSADITTVSADIFTYSPAERFDCIVTDAFLTRFSPEDRPRVVDKWRSLLEPSTGKVITTTRIERPGPTGFVRATPAQADSFRHRAIREARKWADFLSSSSSDIGNRAQRYAERMASYPIESTAELKHLFSANGFEVEALDPVDLPGEMAPTLYAEIVARSIAAGAEQ